MKIYCCIINRAHYILLLDRLFLFKTFKQEARRKRRRRRKGKKIQIQKVDYKIWRSFNSKICII